VTAAAAAGVGPDADAADCVGLEFAGPAWAAATAQKARMASNGKRRIEESLLARKTTVRR
jgi:hypothetical protein